MSFDGPNSGFPPYHSGLEKYVPESGIRRRYFVQIAMATTPDGDVMRNALDNEGRVWFFGEDDWHPLPMVTQGEVKI